MLYTIDPILKQLRKRRKLSHPIFNFIGVSRKTIPSVECFDAGFFAEQIIIK
jgi:hypothetical protein